MTPISARTLETLAAPQWEALEDITFLLPTGSTEQHGPRLPVGTDTAIAVAVCEAASAQGDDLLCAPAIPYGVSHHHKRLPGGAVSAGPRAFADYLSAVVSELVDPTRKRGVIVVNGHGGNWSSIAFVLDALGSAHGELPVAACSWWELVPDLIEGADPHVPAGRVGHAGTVEASVMLALQPDAVQDSTADQRLIGQSGSDPPLHRWLDFSRRYPAGVIGSLSGGEPELGRRLIDVAAERLALLARKLRT